MSPEQDSPSPALLDPNGCLSEAGLVALKTAEIGRAPQGLADHVRSCSRCQNRLLASALSGFPTGRRAPAAAPPLWRVAIVAFMALLVALSLWYMGLLLSPRP